MAKLQIDKLTSIIKEPEHNIPFIKTKIICVKRNFIFGDGLGDIGNFLRIKDLKSFTLVSKDIKWLKKIYTGNLFCRDLHKLKQVMNIYESAHIKVTISNITQLSELKVQLSKSEELQLTESENNVTTLLIHKNQLKCFSHIQTMSDRICEYIGDETTPVEFNPETKKVIKCLSAVVTFSNGATIRTSGNKYIPVERDFNTGKITKCLSIVSAFYNVTIEFNGNTQYPLTQQNSKCLSIIKTFPDRSSIKTYGDIDTPIELDPDTKVITKCLSIIKMLPNGSTIKILGNRDTPIEFNPDTKVITKCLSIIETLPNGAIIKIFGQ